MLVVSSAGALDRNAWTFTKYDVKATVIPEQSAIDVTGEITVRNDSTQPQTNVALQISSSLSWASISVGDTQPSWLTHPYTSDIDHTGSLTEAVVTLAKPLAPKESVTFNVHYGGTIKRDSTRLTRIGTPENVALRSDWDEISPTFTAVRGIGYVTWYPVSIEAANLSKGDEVFDALAGWKARERGSKLKLHIGVDASTHVLLSRAPVTSCRASGPSQLVNVGCFAEGELEADSIPTFVLGALNPIDREHLTVYASADHTSVARDYVVAAEKAQSTLAGWFGSPKRKAVIVELADADALPFEADEYLFTPLNPKIPPLALEVALARTMAHASFVSPRPWISEGLATFSQALIREQQQGRKAGLAYLSQFVNALAVAESQAKSTMQANESSSKQQLPAIGPQPLTQTHDELFYRTKAAFVWAMLRDIVGDDGIRTFLSRYKPEDDHEPSYAQKLLENSGTTRVDLERFFDTWVYADKGLADLRVSSAYAREIISTLPGETRRNFLVTVQVENAGDTWVRTPVIVRAGQRETAQQIVSLEPHSKAVVRITFPGVPEDVVINDGSIPEVDLSDNRVTVQVSASK